METAKRKKLKLDGGRLVEIIEKKEEKKNGKVFPNYFGLAGELGFSISLPIVGGVLLGVFLDDKFNLSPKFTLSLLFLGVFLGIANMYFIIKRLK